MEETRCGKSSSDDITNTTKTHVSQQNIVFVYIQKLYVVVKLFNLLTKNPSHGLTSEAKKHKMETEKEHLYD